jgi:tetratricopeptide (TPR) repeat protein
MVGAFSDNQPDYSWIEPYETKTFKHYWYPVREIGGFKNANLKAAVNLELKANNIAQVGFNATSQCDNATVLLTAGDKVILEQTIDIGPGKPFVKQVPVPAGTQETDLKASLLSPAKDVLIAYQAAAKKYDPRLPQVVKAPPAPSEIENIEQLYLTGLRLEQIHNPRLDPYAYYEEALKRDPGDCRTNTILGINYNKRGMFTKAEEHLKKAIARVSAEYTRPGNAEAYYHLGLATAAQGKFDEAYDVLYRATWDHAFHSAAYYQLAELSCRKGDFAAALEQIDQSLSTNTLNTKALNIKAAILRHLGKLKQAKEIAASVTSADPLDFLAMNELYLAESASPSQGSAQRLRQELMTKMRGEVESYLELAIDYGHCGLWDEAIDVLGRATENKPPLSGVEGTTFAGKYPMVYYYLAYFYGQKGNNSKVSDYLTLAGRMPSDYCFPFRLESIKVLDFAIQHNPSDARAHYYLGNLLYELQPENAIEHWELARRLDDSLTLVHRNLGWAYYRTQKNIAEAIGSYEKAIACDKEDARLYAELDHLYEMGNARLQKRLALLQENHQTVVKRNDSFLREIMLLVLVGRYDEAISFLADNNFHVREGGGEIHDVYVDGHLLRGLLHRKDSRLKEALDDFRAASEYPENLSVGRPKNDRRAPQVAYYTGTAYEASGDSERATEFYKKAASQKGTSQWPETRFYQGLSLAKLGQEDAANGVFDEMIEAGKGRLSQKIEVDLFAKFGEQQSAEAQKASAHYILGLGYLGKGRHGTARSEFEKTVELDVSHVWAKAFLAESD